MSESFSAALDRSLSGTSGFLGMSKKDVQRYSLSKAIRGLVRQGEFDGIEKEMHQELSNRRMGGERPNGIGVPFDVLVPRMGRDLNVNTFGQGGAFVPTEVSPSVIELLRNKTSAVRLGATVLTGLSGNLGIPRQTAPATAYSLPEQLTATKSTEAIDQVLLSPKRVSALVEFSRQLVLQSSVSIDEFLRRDLVDTIGIKLDYLMLQGQGANSEPLGILNTPGVGTVLFGGAATWTNVVSFENQLALANADVPGAKIAWVTTPGTRNRWKTIAKTGTGVTSVVPIFLWETDVFNDDTGDGRVNGYRAACTNQILNNLVFFGNFRDLVLGMFGEGLDLTFNPYSRDTDATVRIVAHAFVDVGIRHPASFVVSSDSGAQ